MDDIDLTLIDVSPRVVSRNGSIQGQYIRLIMIFGHDDQLTVIEFLVAEIDDLRVAAVVFPQQRDRHGLPCFQRGGEQVMDGKVISFLKRILLPDGIAGADVILCQHIGELL